MSATTASSIPGRAKDHGAAAAIGRRRARTDAVIRLLCTLATVLGLLFLVSILATLLVKGASGISLRVSPTSRGRPARMAGC